MTNTEEIVARVGMDLTPIDATTRKLLASQAKAATETASFWTRVNAKRAAEEEAFNKASLERLAQNMAAKEAIAKAYMEKQTAMAVIAGGSGGYGSGFRTAEQEAAGLAEGAAASAVAAKGLKSLGRHAGGFAGILRESAVLMREGLRGNFTKMIGSASILAGMLGTYAAAVAIPLAAILAVPGYKYYKAHKGQEESEASLNNATQDASIGMGDSISRLEKAGVISAGEAKGMRGQLKRGGFENVSGLMNRIRELKPDLLKAEGIQSADRDAAKSQAELDEQNKKARDLVSITKDIQDRQDNIDFLKKNIAALDKDSLESHQATARLLKDEVDQNKDLTEQKNLQAKQNEAAKKWSDEAARSYMHQKINASQEESVYPTIENLAGRSWLKRFSAQYGAGGRYDLGRGDGAFGGVAREYERAKFQQEYDRTYGNIGAAENDRRRMISARDVLIKNGAASPTMLLSKIGDDTGSLRVLFDSLVKAGVIIKGTN